MLGKGYSWTLEIGEILKADYQFIMFVTGTCYAPVNVKPWKPDVRAKVHSSHQGHNVFPHFPHEMHVICAQIWWAYIMCTCCLAAELYYSNKLEVIIVSLINIDV